MNSRKLRVYRACPAKARTAGNVDHLAKVRNTRQGKRNKLPKGPCCGARDVCGSCQ